jgi:hypothetical protein
MPEVIFNIPINIQDEQKLISLEQRIAEINATQKKATTETQKSTAAYQQNSVQVKALRSEQNQLKNAIIKKHRAETADLRTIGGINAVLAEQRQKIQSLVIGSDQYKKVAARIKELETRQRAFNAELGRGKTFVGEYSRGFIDAFKGIAMQAVGAYAVIRAGTAVIKKAIQVNREYEDTLTDVLTLLSEQQELELKPYLTKGTLDLMAKYGLEIKDMNKALFDAISAGIEAGKSIEFLNENAILAVGGASSLNAAILGTTKIMNAYNLQVEETNRVTNALFTAQVYGQTTVQELSENIGTTTSIAQQAGIAYQDLLATFAVLTKRLKNTE